MNLWSRKDSPWTFASQSLGNFSWRYLKLALVLSKAFTNYFISPSLICTSVNYWGGGRLTRDRWWTIFFIGSSDFCEKGFLGSTVPCTKETAILCGSTLKACHESNNPQTTARLPFLTNDCSHVVLL